jgi:hypothetical protein
VTSEIFSFPMRAARLTLDHLGLPWRFSTRDPELPFLYTAEMPW